EGGPGKTKPACPTGPERSQLVRQPGGARQDGMLGSGEGIRCFPERSCVSNIVVPSTVPRARWPGAQANSLKPLAPPADWAARGRGRCSGGLPFARSLPRQLRVKPVRLETDAVQALVDGDVEHVALLADAELHVAGNALPVLEQPFLLGRAGRDEGQLLA